MHPFCILSIAIMKKLILCSTLVAVTIMTAASCSRRNSVTETTIEDDDILAPLPAPIEQPIAAQPVVQAPVPASLPIPAPSVIGDPGLAPLPAPTLDNCDRVPTSKSGLVLFRQNCL